MSTSTPRLFGPPIPPSSLSEKSLSKSSSVFFLLRFGAARFVGSDLRFEDIFLLFFSVLTHEQQQRQAVRKTSLRLDWRIYASEWKMLTGKRRSARKSTAGSTLLGVHWTRAGGVGKMQILEAAFLFLFVVGRRTIDVWVSYYYYWRMVGVMGVVVVVNSGPFD